MLEPRHAKEYRYYALPFRQQDITSLGWTLLAHKRLQATSMPTTVLIYQILNDFLDGWLYDCLTFV